MTTQATFIAYLYNTVGIADPNVRGALNAQGLGTVEVSVTLTKSDIDQLCTAVRRPGGMVTVSNPRYYDATNPVPGVPQNLFVANPGFPIEIIQVCRLKLLCYYVFHLKQTKCAFLDGKADLVWLTDVYRLKEVEDEEPDFSIPE
jgi:hypothetical protein